MSYQKKNWKKRQPGLAQGARGCNQPSTETRAEKLARKANARARFHAAAQDERRVTAILAGERWTKERLLSNGRVIPSRKVESHEYLPHQGEREIARRLRA